MDWVRLRDNNRETVCVLEVRAIVPRIFQGRVKLRNKTRNGA